MLWKFRLCLPFNVGCSCGTKEARSVKVKGIALIILDFAKAFDRLFRIQHLKNQHLKTRHEFLWIEEKNWTSFKMLNKQMKWSNLSNASVKSKEVVNRPFFKYYLCRASRDARLAAFGPFINWGSGLPGILGLEVTIEGLCNPNGGMPAALTWAADKKAGCCKAMNCAAMGFKPGGPPGGPNPFPKGLLSSLGSVWKMIGKNVKHPFSFLFSTTKIAWGYQWKISLSLYADGRGIQNWYSISFVSDYWKNTLRVKKLSHFSNQV